MKTLSALALGLVSFTLSAFAGVDLGDSASRTPYDPYMQSVKHVLCSLDGNGATMDRVQKLMTQGRNFRYSYDTAQPYVAKSPEATAASHSGDCKAKALWLCNQLGDENVRFVVGKAHAGAKLSHAWVLWKEGTTGKWYILDCTNNYRPIAADSVRQDDYVALYSWSKNGAYRHAASSTGYAAVAGKRTTPGVATGELAAQ